MKKILLPFVVFFIAFLWAGTANAQVSISADGSQPDSSAMLDVKSTNKGILPPRVALLSTRVAFPVTNPKSGLLVYNTATAGESPYAVTPGYYCWSVNRWKQVMLRDGSNPGELVYWNGYEYVGLPPGIPGQVLMMGPDTIPVWITLNNNFSPVVITLSASSVLQTTFVAEGNVLGDGGSVVTERGFVYSKTPNPTWFSQKVICGGGTGIFSATISGLTVNTTYYLKAYAINAVDTSYGDQITVNTLPYMPPTIITSPVTNITSTTAQSGGNVTLDGGKPVFFRGVCWDTIPQPLITGNRTIDGFGTGLFSSNLTNLIPRKKYFVRAYAVNSVGESYGDTISFVTGCPVNLVPSVSVTASSTSVCAGTPVTFTAYPVNGGTQPEFQWKVNGIQVGLNNAVFVYIPQNGDLISCTMIPNDPCSNGATATSNTIQMSVSTLVAPSISIVANDSSVCMGTMVTFNALPVNGGNSPVYQWKVNESNAGVNSPNFSYIPANGDHVTCKITSDAACLSQNTATSEAIVISVSSGVTASVSITASAVHVCEGTSVQFTATGVNTGSYPTWQWKKNGVLIAGATNSTYSLVPQNSDAFSCTMTSTLECVQGNPALSNTIAMVVDPYKTVSISITSTATEICAGTQVTFSSAVQNGGSNPVYQWKKNNQNISGATGANYTCAPVNTDVFTCVLTSSETCVLTNVATSNAIPIVVHPLKEAMVTISRSADAVCAGTGVTFTATTVNGGSNPSYSWKVNGTIIAGATSSVYSYPPQNGDVVTCVMTTTEACVTGTPAQSNPLTMTVYPLVTVGVSITSTASTICQGTLVNFTATPVNGGSNPLYQWKNHDVVISGATGAVYSYTPVDNDQISCQLTSNAMCSAGSPAGSNTIVMHVNPLLPVSISVSASANRVCEGSDVTFTAIPVNGGTSPGYQWKKNGIDVTGATTAHYSMVPANGDAVSCVLTSNATCPTGSPATSNSINIVVDPLKTVSISITSTATEMCAGTQVTLSSAIQNGGSNPVYQWKKNNQDIPGANGAGYVCTPANGDVFTCVLISSETCVVNNSATSNAIPMVVHPLKVAGVTISRSADAVCAGTEVTFTAAAINGGSTPSYSWKVNGTTVAGATSAVYTYAPQNADVVTCTMTSVESCVTNSPAQSNPLTMTVHPLVTVGVSISSSATTVCEGTLVSFTATPVNGGSNPLFQWKNHGGVISGATGATYSYTPTDNDQISCQLTSNAMCSAGNPAESNTITMHVNPLLPVSVSVSVSANQVCEGNEVTFTALPVNGGTSPGYQWKKNGIDVIGATTAQYSMVPANGDAVSCVLTSNATCPTSNPATSNSISMVVDPLKTVSITITSTGTDICAGTQVTFSSAIQNGGSNPVYQWKKNNLDIPGANGANYTCTPSNGDVFSCVLTSSESCVVSNIATSNDISVVVHPMNAVNVIISRSADQVCAGTDVTFSAIPVNGGENPIFVWKVNGLQVSGATGSEYTFKPQHDDVISCVMTSLATCTNGNPAQSNPLTMTVYPLVNIGVNITSSATTVCEGTIVSFNATPVNGGSNPIYQWKNHGVVISGATGAAYSYAPVNNDQISCEMISNAMCSAGNPAISNSIVMHVNPLMPVSVSVSVSGNQVCQGNEVTFMAAPVNGGTSPAYQWKKNGIDVPGATNAQYSMFPASNDAVNCLMTSNETCPSGNPATSNTVFMTVYPNTPVSISITASTNNICAGTSVTFSANGINGGDNPSFQWKRNGSNIPGATSASYSMVPENSDKITCEMISGIACPIGNPALSNEIVMNVSPLLPVSVAIMASGNPVCQGTPVTFTATPVNGGSVPIYQWLSNGTYLTGATADTYTYVPTDNETVSCIMTSSETCVSGNPATSNPVIMSVQNSLPVHVEITASANPVCTNQIVVFTASASNGGDSPSYRWLVNGIQSGTDNSVFAFTPQNNDVIQCVLFSSSSCAANNPDTSNAIVMLVGQALVASVTITPSQNPVCAGTEMSFIATPVNGGPDPVYLWTVNNEVVGDGSFSMAYVPENNDKVKCTMTSNASCLLVSHAESNIVNMVVEPNREAVVTVTASATSLCMGSSVTLTAVPENGGVSPLFQWLKNGIPVEGATSSVYQFTATGNGTFSCTMNSNASCVLVNPVASNTVDIYVNPLLQPEITIQASDDSVCAGTHITYTASVVNGGNNPVFQWYKSGNPVSGATSYIYVNVANVSETVYCELNSAEPCATVHTVVSNSLVQVVFPVLPVEVSVTASANQICAGTAVTFSASALNPGLSPAYQWLKNNLEITGATNSTYTYIPQNDDQIACRMIPDVICPSVSQVTSAPVTMSVNPVPVPGVTIEASATNICAGSLVTITSNPENGGTTPVYEWFVNGAKYNGVTGAVFTYAPSANDMVFCKMTSNATCITGSVSSNQIIFTVNPVVSPIAMITASDNPVCEGTTVTFEATVVNGGTEPTYNWLVNGEPRSTGSPLFSYIPDGNDLVCCVITSNAGCTVNNPATSNCITMTVNPLVPVSVSIATLSDDICAGSVASLTATAVNGGTEPIYQWQINGVNSGDNSPEFNFLPVNGDVVTCTLISNLECATNNPAESNEVTINVSEPQTVSISIMPSAYEVCPGTAVSFTSSIANGGTQPAYQWMVNGTAMANASNPDFSYVPANNDVVTCRLISSAPCVIENTVFAPGVTITVNPLSPVSVSVVAGENPVCSGTMVTFSAIAVNPGTNPQYKWKVNGTIVSQSGVTYQYIPLNNDKIECILTSNAPCATQNPATSPALTMSVNPPLIPGSISGNQTVCTNAVPAILMGVPPANGTTYSYQWQKSENNSSFVTIPGAVGLNYQPEPVSVVTYFRQLQNAGGTCGGPLATNTVTLSVTQPLAVSAAITANPAGVTYIGTPVTFTATVMNGGAAPVYTWKVNNTISGTNSSTFIYTPSNGDVVSCQVLSALSCVSNNPAVSNSITMIVSSDPLLPVTVTIAANPSGPVCPGTPVTYTATPGNGGNAPMFQWKVNGQNAGTNNPVYTYSPGNGDIIHCVMTSDLINVTGNPATSNSIQAIVDPVSPVSVAISASAEEVCDGQSVTFTATAVNPGTSPVYRWYVNNELHGTNDPIFSWTPADNDQVKCIVTSSLHCASGNPATSNEMTISVLPRVQVSVSISASQTNVCQGSTVTFTAYPVNAGSNPEYHWRVNGINSGTNQPTFSYTPANNDVISCLMLTDVYCASANSVISNDIRLTVNPISPVSLSISASATSVCKGTEVTFTALPVNPGDTPVYQWKLNGINAGTNSNQFSYTGTANFEVSCQMTTSILCPSVPIAFSNSIPVTVNPLLPVSITVAPSANPVCEGTLVQYTATAQNAGSMPVFQWKVNGTNVFSGSSVYSYMPGNHDTVNCMLFSNVQCGTGNPAISEDVVMTVNPYVSASVTVTPSANNVCAGAQVTFTAAVTNGGTSPAYQWLVNDTVRGTNSSVFAWIPKNGDMVKCKVTLQGTCFAANPVWSTPVSMIVSPVVTAGVTVAASANPVCAGTSVTFTATPVNGGTNPAFQWLVNGTLTGTNQAVFVYTPANNDVVSCRMTSNAQCVSGNPATAQMTMIVNPRLTVSVSIEASQNPACHGTVVTFTATPVNGGSNPSYYWKVNNNPDGTNSPVFSYTPLDGDVVSCEMISSMFCTNGSLAYSNSITMDVNPINPVEVSITPSANSICAGTTVTFTAVPVNGGTTPVYTWKVNGAAAGYNSSTYSYFPANGDKITCTLTSNISCPSGNPAVSDTITMNVTPSPACSVSVTPSATNVCSGTSVTYTATPTNGGASPTYQWKVRGVIQSSATTASFTYTPSAGDTVQCVLTSSLSCVTGSPATNKVLVTVNNIAPVSVSVTSNPAGSVCQGSTVVYTANPVNGGTSPAYQWKKNGTNISGATNATYSYAPASSTEAISCQLTSNASCITGNPALSNSVVLTVNSSLTVSVAVWTSDYAVMPGTTLVYKTSVVNGGTSPTYQWTKNGANVSGATNSTYSYAPVNNDNIACKVTTSLAGCAAPKPATSNTVNMIVYTTGTPCSGTPTVVHEGKTYNAVQIGTQCWLRENLNVGNFVSGTVTPSNNAVVEKFCYNNDTNNCNVYGGLYQWAEAMQYLNGVTNTTHWTTQPTNVQGICPTGWHVPTNTEVQTMITTLGGSSAAGGAIKEVGTVHWGQISYPYNIGATNTSGFTALPSGSSSGNTFGNLRQYMNVWTTTKGNQAVAAYFFGATFAAPDIVQGQSDKALGYGIRCVKN